MSVGYTLWNFRSSTFRYGLHCCLHFISQWIVYYQFSDCCSVCCL